MARSGSPKFQCRPFVYPPRTWTPARRCTLTFDARIDTGFREMNPLTQCVVVSFSGLDTFTCVAADRLLYQGLTRFVTSSCAWFSSELLVRLCSCRISRLVYISFAWRTHFGHPCAEQLKPFLAQSHKATKNSHSYHEVHEDNEDNTLSQCILCGRPA
jgi:hypothetical protein